MKVPKEKISFTLKSPFLPLQKSYRLNYFFYPFIFPLTFLKYKLLMARLMTTYFLKTLDGGIIQTQKLNFLKNCYTNFLKQKKKFTQYLYEFNFLKCSYFSSLFSNYLKQKRTTLLNVPLLTNSSVLKNLADLSKLSEFSNLSLKQRLRKTKSMNFLKIVPLFFNKSQLKNFLISHTVQLYAQQLKLKRKKESFLNTNDSIFYYSFELQTQIYKIQNYSKSKRKKNIEFSFFKIHLFILKYIINLFTLESLDKYDTSQMNLKLKKSKFTNIRTLGVFEFQPWQDQLLNYEIKFNLYMLEYLFFKTPVSECINLVHLNPFYNHMSFNFSDKYLTKSTSLFEEFIKKLYLNSRNLISENLNLILFKFDKKDQKFQNDFAMSKIKILSFENLEFIYRKLRCFMNVNSKIFRHFDDSIFFSDLNKNINPFNLLFLNSLSRQNFNPCFSKYLENQLFETFIFDKIIQMKFSRFKKYFIEPFKKKDTHLKKNQTIFKKIMISFIRKVKGCLQFFESIVFNKRFDIEFSYFLFAYKVKNKFLRYLKIYFSYSMIFLYIEKNNWQVLVLTNQFFSIFNESFSLKLLQCWFSSNPTFFKIESDFYLYTFHKAYYLNNGIQKKIETEIKKNNKKFVIIYKNFLFVFLNSKKFFKLPKKEEHKTYLDSLKKIVKTYSNKNQIFLIEVLNKKIYGWSYNYRFIFIQDYFLQLDQKLFKFLWTWAIRRHNNKNKNWIKTKYFHTLRNKNWIFGSYILDRHNLDKLQGSTKFIYISFHSQVLFNLRNSLGTFIE